MTNRGTRGTKPSMGPQPATAGQNLPPLHFHFNHWLLQLSHVITVIIISADLYNQIYNQMETTDGNVYVKWFQWI